MEVRPVEFYVKGITLKEVLKKGLIDKLVQQLEEAGIKIKYIALILDPEGEPGLIRRGHASSMEAEKPEKIIAFVKTSLVLRRFSIKLSDVVDITQKDWDEIRGFLERKLKEQGFLRADVLADALIEEAKARASALVKKYFGGEAPSLIDEVAKYILAFALAERLDGEEEA